MFACAVTPVAGGGGGGGGDGDGDGDGDGGSDGADGGVDPLDAVVDILRIHTTGRGTRLAPYRPSSSPSPSHTGCGTGLEGEEGAGTGTGSAVGGGVRGGDWLWDLAHKPCLRDKLEWMSGADLEGVCREAAMLALREDRAAVALHRRHMAQAIAAARPTITPQMLHFYDNFRSNR